MTPLTVMRLTVCLLAVGARVVVGCGFPGSPAHSSVSFSTVKMEAGTEATYSCDRGFELLGPSRRVCQTNGTWTPSGIPFCVINVAAGKAPMQSSTHQDGIPQKAVDGSTSGLFSPQTCTLTQPETSPLWYVNLLEPFMIQLVRIDFGRACCERNLPATVVVRVGNNRPDLLTNPICNRFTGVIEEGRPLFLPCNPPMPGAFVSVHLEGPGQKRLSICETFVYTDQALPVERCPQFRGQPLGASATYNGRCYTFYNEQPRSFGRAQEFCAARKGTLISETSPALQGFLSWELWRRHRSEPDGQYWLGAVRDAHRPAVWSWLNGQQVSISFWSVPERIAGGDCARLDATKDWLWSAADCRQRINFVCQHEPLTCGRPEQPPDSVMAAAEFGIGARITYRCEPGHLLVGPEERQCLSTGFYSGYPPTCKRLQCGLPADIGHGSYRFQNGSRAYLSTVAYSCDPGYTLVGRSELICDVDERWNGPPPRCQEVRCGTPPAILNGAFLSVDNDTTVGSMFEYHCLDDRFELIGSALLRCGPDGRYDNEPPICRAPEASSTTTAATTTTTAASTATTEATTAATVDLSFLDEALAASASEVNHEHIIDLGDLLDLLGGGPGHHEGTNGTAVDRQGVGAEPTGIDHLEIQGTGIESRIDLDLDSIGPRGDGAGAEEPAAVTDTHTPPEYASEAAAAHLAAATDLSFAFRPTEGSPAAFDISIHYRPAGEVVSSSPAPPLGTDPHRRGRPPSAGAPFPDQWGGTAAGGTARPDGIVDDLNWSERTPSWPSSPPGFTISLSDLSAADSTGDAASRAVTERSRPRPTPAITPGGFFKVLPPVEYARAPQEAGAARGGDRSSFPGHRGRYRPVVRRTHLPSPADSGSYGLRRRFRPISLADIAATEFPAASESVTERRKTSRSEDGGAVRGADVQEGPPQTPRHPAASTERVPAADSGRLPEVQFTLMPPSFWPDLHPARSDEAESAAVSPPPYRPVRLRPPPGPADDGRDVGVPAIDSGVEYGPVGDDAINSESAGGGFPSDFADYESIDRSEPTELVPPTVVWEPARTSAPVPLPDLTPPPTRPPTPLPPRSPPPPSVRPAAHPSPSPPPPATAVPTTSELPPVAATETPASGTPPPVAAAPGTPDVQQPAVYDRPEDSRQPDTVNIRQNVRPEVRLPDVGEDRRETGDATATTAPRLNLSGIIALGVFGGFVFLTAVLTSIVIIVRRTQQRTRRRSPRRHHYISSSYSTDSESHGLSRHSRRGGWAAGGRPAGRHSSSQGYRDSAEVTVADVAHMFRGGDKRRHHHHHHHRHHHGDERSRRH